MSFLVVTRRVGEAVDCSINGKPLVSVKVMALLPDGIVRLGFEADRSVHILRDNALARSEERDGNNDYDGASPINGNR